MEHLKIVIACDNVDLRSMVWSLLPDVDPAGIDSMFYSVLKIIHAVKRGEVDLVIIDEAFSKSDPNLGIKSLASLAVPLVALVPSLVKLAPDFEGPTTAEWKHTAQTNGAVQLDLPTTARGMWIAIECALFNREGSLGEGRAGKAIVEAAIERGRVGAGWGDQEKFSGLTEEAIRAGPPRLRVAPEEANIYLRKVILDAPSDHDRSEAL